MTSGITLSISLEDAEKLSTTIKALKCRMESAEGALVRERKEFDDYRSAESERLDNERKRNEETLQQRLAVVEKIERKNAELEDYISAKSHYVSVIYAIVKNRLTKTERQNINAEKVKLDAAWEKFDVAQKECAK